MKRRHYLSIVTAGIVGLAGCSSTNETASEDPEKTQTETIETTQGEPEFNAEVVAPESVDLGEDLQIGIQVENTGNATGVWTGTLEMAITYSETTDPEEVESIEEDYEIEIPAGESAGAETDGITIDEPLFIHYRLDEQPFETIAIPESKEPILENVNIVSDWQSFGDAIENKISDTEVGSLITIASRYWYYAENQSMEAFRQVEIYNSNNERVDIGTAVLEQVTEYGGWGEWESYQSFSTTDWEPGTYTAEVLIRDEQNQEVSEGMSVEFELE